MAGATRYWFPAKTYGWGWGFPVCWQGWLALFAFMALVGAGAWWFPPTTAPLRYGVFVALQCVWLVALCWLNGEPPAWHWGRR